ncbi:MAG: hypothetical protein ACREL3_14075 [Gemmatimonadales bacterium]
MEANWSFPQKRIDPVTALPLVPPDSPLGIVIKSGGPVRKPARFWAYLWAADEEFADDHWHQRVPTEHAA